MALTKQTLTLSLREGLDTKSDPKQVVAGRLLILENGVLTKLGAIQKRNGYSRVPSAVADVRILSTFKSQMFAAGNGAGYSYAPSQGTWTAEGACDAVQVSATPVVRNSYQQTSQDAVVHPNGVTVVAWEDSSGGSRYSVIDTATGQPIVASTLITATATRPKCAILGNYVVVAFYDTAIPNHLRYIAIPTLMTNAPTAPADLAINVNANQSYDVAASGGILYFVYANTAGGAAQLSARYLTTALIVSSELQVAAAALPANVGTFVDSVNGRVWATWDDGANVRAVAMDVNVTAALFTPVVIDSATASNRRITGIVPSDTSIATILFDVAATPAYNGLTRISQVNWLAGPPSITSIVGSATGGTLAAGTHYYVVTALGVAGETLASVEHSVVTVGTTSSVTLAWAAVPGAAGYRVYRGTSSGGENTYFAPGAVTTFTDIGAAGTAGAPPSANSFVGVVAGAVAFRSVNLASKPWYVNGTVHWLGGYSSALQSTYFILTPLGVVGQVQPGTAGGVPAKPILPEVTQSAAGVFVVATLAAYEIGAQSGIVLSQTGINTTSLDYTAQQMGLELSDNLHVTGGMLYGFDGARLVEHNFLLYPENIAAVPSGSGGGMLAGQYQYVVVFEWWDNFGIHQSAPSVPTTVTTTGSTSSVALTIPTLRITNKTTPISVVVYRTAANGTVFYRLNSVASPLLNSTTADTVGYTDTIVDASIIGNAQLYTTGGEVDNQAAPAPGPICNYGNRIMLVSSENPLTIWYSKQVIQGVPVEFAAAFQITVDQRGGPITAMSQMDDKLIIFKRRWIFGMVGDGPAPNGLPVPGYPQPDLITADSGCPNPKSLVLIPTGLMYQSDKGIYLLGRDLSTTYIGAAVEAHNSAAVTSATQVPNTTQVRFTLDSGICLVYDWLVDQWATFTNIAAADATIFQGVFTYCQASGMTFMEAPGTFTDAGDQIKLRLQTSWLSFAGLQGFQRVWEMLVLGEYRSAHTLRVSVAYDFDPTPHQVMSVPAANLLGRTTFGADSPYGAGTPYGGAFPLYQFRLKMLQEKCQSIQITIEDIQSPPYGEGMALSAISFSAGVIGGTKKVPANRTFGA